jgi:hypothetical protein
MVLVCRGLLSGAYLSLSAPVCISSCLPSPVCSPLPVCSLRPCPSPGCLSPCAVACLGGCHGMGPTVCVRPGASCGLGLRGFGSGAWSTGVWVCRLPVSLVTGLGAGCWVLDAGCWVLGSGCWGLPGCWSRGVMGSLAWTCCPLR